MTTFALIPGGGGDPWEWHRLVPALNERGHEAIAVRLPADDDSAGWSEYADAVVDALDDREEVIVVAASMGGFTAPIVCTRWRHPRAAMIPVSVTSRPTDPETTRALTVAARRVGIVAC